MPNRLTMELEQSTAFTGGERGRLDAPVRVLDARGLKTEAKFNPGDLHLDRTEAGDREVAGRAGDLV